ncbi:MAG: glycosyl hydrolase family 57, partial [Deltaproteobacteria bacterium]
MGALALLLLMAPARGVFAAEGANPPIHIAFLWHLHQPIYWPYETVVETEDAHRYSFSVLDVHLQRIGPYTAWPMDAVAAGMNAGLAHLGAQVSLSGSLIENLNEIERAGRGFANWKARWREAMSWKTVRNHPRIDLVAFGYHHPLMGLIPPEEIGRQIALHRKMLEENFGREAAASKGFFPPETAFSSRMIPALLDAGIEWVIIDSIHLERAHQDYPYTPASNLYPPNPADQRNDAPTAWVQLTNIWAPSKVAAPFAYRPHYAAHTDPETGITRKIIVVPAARYEGNEDARGGFGALQYEQVMSQYEAYNTDPRHPMLVVLHHDGDNFGGGSDAYYHSNFDDFIAWLQANPDRFVCTTIQDYLDMFP